MVMCLESPLRLGHFHQYEMGKIYRFKIISCQKVLEGININLYLTLYFNIKAGNIHYIENVRYKYYIKYTKYEHILNKTYSKPIIDAYCRPCFKVSDLSS